MSETLRARWLAELRSGKYQQATDALREIHLDGPHYCCLGVGGCILVQEGLAKESQVFNSGKTSEILSETEAAYFDLTFDQQRLLAQLNDAGMSFEKIADAIESGQAFDRNWVEREVYRIQQEQDADMLEQLDPPDAAMQAETLHLRADQ